MSDLPSGYVEVDGETLRDPWKGPPPPAWNTGLGFNDETAYLGPFYRALEGAGQGAAKGEQLMAGAYHFSAQALAELGEATHAPATPLLKRIERSTADFQREADERVRALTPNAATTGAAVQTINGLASGAYRVGVGSLVGGLGGPAFLGSTEGANRYQELRDAGVDEVTARRAAILTGMTNGIGAYMPAAYGRQLLTRLLTGSTSNMGFGIVNRYADHQVLDEGGYHDMADQQVAMDGTQLLADGLLGASFGGLHHVMAGRAGESPARDVPGAEDAALTANLALRDRALAPGVPADPSAAVAHDAALRQATNDLLMDRPVNVADTGVDEATFVGRHVPDQAEPREMLLSALRESGALDEERHLQQLEAALGARHSGEKAGVDALREEHIGKLAPEQQQTMRELFARADEAKPSFDRTVQDVAQAVGGEPVLAPVKGAPRTVEKVLGDYAGDPSRMKDLVRASVNVPDLPAALRAIEEIKQRFQVLPTGQRNLLDENAEPMEGGYRDAKFNVRLANGSIGEIQVQLPEMAAAKMEAHGLYEQRSALARKIGTRPPTEAQQAKLDELTAQMRALYEPVWKEFLSRSKASAVSGEPFRSAESSGKGRGAMPSNAQEPAGPKATGTPSTSENLVPSGQEAAGPRIGVTEPGAAEAGLPLRGAGLTAQSVPPGTHQVMTATGRRVTVNPKVVELGSLITSDKVNYPAELQPRQRGERAALTEQVRNIAQNLNPELLGNAPEADRGAPIIGPDQVVESGNGRAFALREAYANNPEGAAAYRAFLERQGFNTEGMKQPVLVRERVTPMTAADRREFTVEANQTSVAALSPVERAQADARLLDGAALSQLRPGELSTAGNAGFVRAFMERLPASERNAMVNPDGTVSQEGVRRLQGAILAKAYGGAAESNAVLGRMLESTDNDMRSTMGALLDAAPSMAKLRDAIAEGKVGPQYDVARALTQAVETAAAARNAGQALQEHLSQGDLYARRPPLVEALARTLYDRKGERLAGREKVAQSLMNYADRALKQRLDQGMLFGDAPATPEQLLAAGEANEAEKQQGAMKPAADMFGLRTAQGSKEPAAQVAEAVLKRSPNLEIPAADGPTRARAELIAAEEQTATGSDKAPGALDTVANCANQRAA